MGERPIGKCLDRINNDGNYCPENCRWASQTTQNNNRGNNVKIIYNGEEKTLSMWARYLGISPGTFWARINSNMDNNSIFTRGVIR